MILIAAAVCIGVLVQLLLQDLPGAWLWLGILMSSLIAHRSLIDHVRAVADALEQSLEDARRAVAEIVGRDPQKLDATGVARASVESLAENFSDGVVAPIFWAAAFGLPGILALKTINTLDSMIGYRNDRYLYFGRASARIDDVVNWLPARLTALLFSLVSRHPISSVRIAIRDAGHHASPNAGWPEAAMAGALEVKLAGPRHYADRYIDDPYVGDGTAKLTVQHIRAGVRVTWRAWALMTLGLCAVVFA